MVRSVGTGVLVVGGSFLGAVLVVQWLVGGVPIGDPTSDLGVLVPLGIAFAVVALSARDLPQGRVAAWLVDRGFRPTRSLVDAAGRWLRRTRTLRGAGVAVVFAVGQAAPWLVNVADVPVDAPVRDRLLDLVNVVPPWAILVGYGVGALVAELLRRPLDPDGPRVADLRPRDPVAYLQPFARVGPRVAALVLALAVAFRALAVGDASWAVTLLGAAAIVGCAETVQRAVVSRRQVAAAGVAVALDDAARVTTMHAVAGTAMGLLVLLAAEVLWGAAVDMEAGNGAVALLGFALTPIGYGLWLGHGVGLVQVVRRGWTGQPEVDVDGDVRSAADEVPA